MAIFDRSAGAHLKTDPTFGTTPRTFTDVSAVGITRDKHIPGTGLGNYCELIGR